MSRMEHPAAGTPREIASFRAGATEGRLVLPRCASCGRQHWYPRAVCPFCLSADIQFEESPGRGRIYAATTFHSGGQARIVAYVELDEGLRLLTNVMTDDPMNAAIGQRVAVLFRPTDGAEADPQPFFRPVPED